MVMKMTEENKAEEKKMKETEKIKLPENFKHFPLLSQLDALSE